MNEFLAFNVDAGWASLAVGGITLLGGVLFRYYGDARWVRKPDLDREVKSLQSTDADVQKSIDDLSATVKAQDLTRGTQLADLKDQMVKGFENLTSTFNAGILKLSTDAAEMRGRLAGASGVSAKAE